MLVMAVRNPGKLFKATFFQSQIFYFVTQTPQEYRSCFRSVESKISNVEQSKNHHSNFHILEDGQLSTHLQVVPGDVEGNPTRYWNVCFGLLTVDWLVRLTLRQDTDP